MIGHWAGQCLMNGVQDSIKVYCVRVKCHMLHVKLTKTLKKNLTYNLQLNHNKSSKQISELTFAFAPQGFRNKMT